MYRKEGAIDTFQCLVNTRGTAALANPVEDNATVAVSSRHKRRENHVSVSSSHADESARVEGLVRIQVYRIQETFGERNAQGRVRGKTIRPIPPDSAPYGLERQPVDHVDYN